MKGCLFLKNDILKKNIILLILIFIIGLISVISLKSFYKSNIIDILSNDLYKKDVNYLLQTDSITLSDLIYLSNDSFISKELSQNTRGIYFSKRYNYYLPIIEGRFFNSNDFKEYNNYVVVGQNLKPSIYYKNNKMYYKYAEKEYEVIGILGFNIESKLDDIIIFNLINIYDIVLQKTKIVIGLSEEELINNIKVKNLTKYINLYNIQYEGISRIWDSSNIYNYIFFTIYVTSMISIFLLIYLKSYYYIKYIKVFNILGFKNSFIFKNIFLFEAFIYLISFILGILIYIYLFMEDYYINKQFIILIINFSFFNYIVIIFFNFIINIKKLKNIMKKRW